MKNFITILAVMLMIVACGQKQPIQYIQREAHNGAYVCDIPTSVSPYKSIRDMMSFTGDNSQTMIMIQEMDESRSLESYTEEIDYSSKGYNVSVYSRTEQSVYLHITKGMWSGYDLFKTKELGGRTYIIKVSSDNLGKAALEEIINHIHDSLKNKEEVTENTGTVEKEKLEATLKTFSNQSFSLSYPADWKVVKNPDGMSDVYIGAENERLGFTVLHFPCDYSLQEVIDEANSNSRSVGIKIVENKKVKVCGVDAYKTIYTHFVSGISVKEISFTFLAKGEAYNVKFGTDPKLLDEKREDIERIVSSIKIK